MIHIQYVRVGLHVLAFTFRDDGTPEVAVGFTQWSARRQLCNDKHIQVTPK